MSEEARKRRALETVKGVAVLKALKDLVKAVDCDLTASIMKDCPLIRVYRQQAELVIEREALKRKSRKRATKTGGQ